MRIFYIRRLKKNIMKLYKFTFLFLGLLCTTVTIKAQNQQLFSSQQFRLGDRIIRIAEQGEIADSINVWGDIGSSGRYLIPKGTSLPKLISYALGPRTLNDGQTQLDWSKMRIEVNIQEYNPENGVNTIKKFRYRFEDPYPDGMYNFILVNNQTVTLRVKRKPTLRDYLSVIAPAISAVATSITTAILISDRIKN